MVKNWLKKNGLELAISLLFIFALAVCFFLWQRSQRRLFWFTLLSAALSAGLFALFFLRALPRWIQAIKNPEPLALPGERVKHAHLQALCLFALALAFYVVLTATARLIAGKNARFWDTFRLYGGLDTPSYFTIAKQGYTWRSDKGELLHLVFFPGYPTLCGLLLMVIPNEMVCGYLAAWIPFLLSGPVLYDLLRLDHGHWEAMRILLLICLAPAAVFYAYPMSESLFLLCMACCLYFARTKKWLAAGLWGLLASFTRVVGILLLLPMAMEWWAQFKTRPSGAPLRESLKDAACMLLTPLGLAFYLYINFTMAGDPFIFLQYQQSNWHQHASLFFSTAAMQADYAWRTLLDGKDSFWGLWLPNLMVGFGSLALMAAAGKKLRPAYSALFAVYFCVCYGSSWLLSGPRYMAVFFPLAIAAEKLPIKRKGLLPLLILPFTAAYTVLFALRVHVW